MNSNNVNAGCSLGSPCGGTRKEEKEDILSIF
jgi:hypothetical protein